MSVHWQDSDLTPPIVERRPSPYRSAARWCVRDEMGPQYLPPEDRRTIRTLDLLRDERDLRDCLRWRDFAGVVIGLAFAAGLMYAAIYLLAGTGGAH